MKRTVKIDSIGLNGVVLEVTFGKVPVSWPNLSVTTTTSSLSVNHRNNELIVKSPQFNSPSAANVWITDLTKEVNQLLDKDRELVELFKPLEGEEEVPSRIFPG